MLLIFLMISLGCAKKSNLNGWPDSPYALPSTWINAAERHEQAGDLQRALYEYRIARTVSARDTSINSEIKRLEDRIEKKSKSLMRAAKKAQDQGKLARAHEYYLEVLSLEPKHQKALEALRRLDKNNQNKRMQKKVALSQRYRERKSHKKTKRDYEDEGYVYSRQAILQAESRAADVPTYIADIEKHIKKYPQDTELKEMLLNIRIVQARAAFQSAKYEKSLYHLSAAEKLFKHERKASGKLAGIREELGRDLYLKGVQRVRTEPVNALKLWKTALKFNPNDKRTLLRIQNIEKQ
jgi:tetratricopeptide (TPR) repeat protein